jgi:hypothetical protein
MKDNTRHVPGSTRSSPTPLSLNAISVRRLQTLPEKSVQNPYKSDHFRECDFFNHSVSTTYNFNALKCTDFPAPLYLNPNLNLNRPAPDSLARHAPCPVAESGQQPSVPFFRIPPITPIPAGNRATHLPILYTIEQTRTISNSIPFRPRSTNDLRRRLVRSFNFPGGNPTIPNHKSKMKRHKMTHFERKKGWGVRHLHWPLDMPSVNWCHSCKFVSLFGLSERNRNFPETGEPPLTANVL